jgi:hypothetical protein
MKRSIAIVLFLLINAMAFSQVKLYLGARGGGGVMMSKSQLKELKTQDGRDAVFKNRNAWSAQAKGEVLLGFKRLRIGYQFLYNFSAPINQSSSEQPLMNREQFATYLNSSQTQFFGHYALVEVAVINRPHFALTPGIAIGTYTGFNRDENTNEAVKLRNVTKNRFSIGTELNFEAKFGRCVIFGSPNYYLFSMQDKASKEWKQYKHFLGADIGFRVNLLPQSK